MVTDVILSGLTNLFALFGARNNVDRSGSHSILRSYLSRHLGVQNVSAFLEMYDDLRDLYDVMPELNKSQTIRDVNNALKGQIDRHEREMMLLRLMQFCAGFGSKDFGDKRLFSQMADTFGISQERYAIFRDFVFDGISSSVHHHVFDGLDGHLTTLWLEDTNRLLFTYHGNSTVMMDDIPVIPDTFQTWARSSVLKVQHSGLRLYYANIATPFPASPIEGEGPRFARRLARCGSQEMAKLAKQGSSPSMGFHEVPEHLLERKRAGEGVVVFAGSLDFRFPNSDNGIHDFSFSIQGSELVAVMGGSGTGKSTLMSLLNGTLTPQRGSVMLNGHSITEPSVKSLIGFVPQDDLLVEELTVYQNLWYTAKLWFHAMDNTEIDRRVNAVLQQLGLEQTRNLKVGSPLQKTISGGQRKRLNIALELIRNPTVLFIDEPTSGLSSSDSEKVINILKELTYEGKLIIINIHQPSSDVYKLFDRLWILDRGGYPIYDGNPIEAITYFKEAAGYADAEVSTCRTCGNINPEIILNIVEEKALDESGEISTQRKVTPQQWHALYRQSVKGTPDLTPTPSSHDSNRQEGNRIRRYCETYLTYLRRNISTKRTNVQYLLITLLASPVLAVICSWLTHYAPQEGYSVMDNKNLVSYLFMSVIVATFLGMSGSAEEIIRDRALLRRERFLSLPYGSYIASKVTFMTGVVALQTLLYVLVGNSIQGLSLLPTWWGILFATAFVAGLTGLLLSRVMKSVVAIYITIPLLLIPQILLCGLVVDFQDLTPGSRTGNVPLIGNVIPSRWAYEALAVEQFKGNSYEAPLFSIHKEKYETQYYNMVYLYEVQSQLETMHHEASSGQTVASSHLDVIRKALPTLAQVTQLPPYSGDYTYPSLKAYTDKAGHILSQRSNRATLAEDALVRSLAMQPEALMTLKRSNYNKQLETLCVNADAPHTHDIVDGTIVPRVGFIYLTPLTHYGNAPFYSAEKRLASWHIPTLWFNMGVMLLMSLILLMLLNLPLERIKR